MYMWKESYKIGVEAVDRQHRELFSRTDSLLKAIEAGVNKTEITKMIAFLKRYVMEHFEQEEAYQQRIGYEGFTEHKKMHQDFAEAVLSYEKRLLETEYAMPVVKDLAGMLTSWLIYHVADADQKMVKKPEKHTHLEEGQCLAVFASSLLDVLEKMTGEPFAWEQEAEEHSLQGDVLIKIGLIGQKQGQAVFAFTREFAFCLLEAMTFQKPAELDEFVKSALSEIANISSGNAATLLAETGICCDIEPPCLVEAPPAQECLKTAVFQTGMGRLAVAAFLQ